MTDLSNLPSYFIAATAFALVSSYLVSKVLRLSLLLSIVGGVSPLALPFSDLSSVPQVAALKPYMQMAWAWGLLLCVALVWVLLRGCMKRTSGPLGMLRLGYAAVLCAALAVVGVLFSKPALLDTYLPSWRGSGGLVLLCATLLSMLLAFVRIFRTAALLVLWSFVSIVLASEIFLQKMPTEIAREDLRGIESLVRSETLQAAVKRLPLNEE